MRLAKVMAIGTLTACVAACQTTSNRSSAPELESEGFVKMTGAEVQSSLVGNSLDGEDSDGEYVIYYPTETEMRITYLGIKETGVWRVEGDKYCRRWKTIGGGNERCVDFYRKDEQINWLRDGRLTDRSVLVPGNPEAL